MQLYVDRAQNIRLQYTLDWIVRYQDPSEKSHRLNQCYVFSNGITWQDHICGKDLHFCAEPPPVGWSLTLEKHSQEPVPIIQYPCSEYIYNWRLDNHGNWKLIFTHTVDDKLVTVEYKVDMHVLKQGPNKCNYFSFDAEDFSEHETQASTFESFHPIVVEQVPTFLDYVYLGVLRIMDRTAISLLVLADYFGCESLLNEVKTYCRQA